MFKLHDDWHWMVNHAWSLRFLVLAFLLSAAEVVLPIFNDHLALPLWLYASTMALLTPAAYFARIIAQDKDLKQ